MRFRCRWTAKIQNPVQKQRQHSGTGSPMLHLGFCKLCWIFRVKMKLLARCELILTASLHTPALYRQTAQRNWRRTCVVCCLQNVRLLATVLAKNAVGSSWRKTLGTREWSRIPETEKSHVRSAAASLLLNEPQRRVATQTGLLIANIARFDFPAKWPTLLSDLTSAAWWAEDEVSQAKIEQNDRALFTLKHVVRAVKSKRIVVETSGPSGGSVSTAGMSCLCFTVGSVLGSVCLCHALNGQHGLLH